MIIPIKLCIILLYNYNYKLYIYFDCFHRFITSSLKCDVLVGPNETLVTVKSLLNVIII